MPFVFLNFGGITGLAIDRGFNEIVDLVRGLLDDQDDLIQETEETQKKRILEFLK